ncbi:hypothetical protein HF650_22875 [Kosakonia sp. SMBL-WEM22]|uniref:hypothetical protein n=1 Tax=Kosakonia sp. SMBL-WEM22 TaxID=2725560 RepID=UPI00165A031E|nr:hypothetical protein [Kosakonia sp. SMBL-WEM22]MDV5354222.1 hypothetical protein [Enterobacter asburiae]QNQ22361.1 hypothetical protein HF650_22875 [Kosakonia sp. SMBL-WEM22]
MPKDYENILAPDIAKNIIKKEYVIESSPNNILGSIDGYTIKPHHGFKYGLPHDPLGHQKENYIDSLIDKGTVVVVRPNVSARNRFYYPFFISESAELFCVQSLSFNAVFVRTIINGFKDSVAVHGRPAPTRSDFAPVTDEFGPGYWKTSETDFHGVKNAAVMLLNRATSMGDEGRVFGSDGKDYMNTSRDKIQLWTPLPADLASDTREFIYNRSVIRRYGEKRTIYQKYLEGDDAWAVSGKSWHWIPGVRDEDYEFKK